MLCAKIASSLHTNTSGDGIEGISPKTGTRSWILPVYEVVVVLLFDISNIRHNCFYNRKIRSSTIVVAEDKIILSSADNNSHPTQHQRLHPIRSERVSGMVPSMLHTGIIRYLRPSTILRVGDPEYSSVESVPGFVVPVLFVHEETLKGGPGGSHSVSEDTVFEIDIVRVQLNHKTMQSSDSWTVMVFAFAVATFVLEARPNPTRPKVLSHEVNVSVSS